jgi:hypothetical protein
MAWVILLFPGTCGVLGAEGPTARIAPGCSYLHDVVAEVPWSIHVIKIARARQELELHTTVGGGVRIGLGPLSAQVKSLPATLGRPIAAINGDYYENKRPYAGDAKGLQILQGELVSGPSDWTCFWMDTARVPHQTNVVSRFQVIWPNNDKLPLGLNQERPADAAVLYTAAMGASTRTRSGRELFLERLGTNDWLPLRIGRTYAARIREVRNAGDTPLAKDVAVLSLGRQLLAQVPELAAGDTVKLSTATWPDLTGVTVAIGGGPAIIHGGQIVAGLDDDVRHPRTALGWNKDSLYLMEVDGRQLGLSVGMTYPELAKYMKQLGCDEAMCLDGGASATCWVHGQVINNPSAGHERAMATGLVVVLKDTKDKKSEPSQ